MLKNYEIADGLVSCRITPKILFFFVYHSLINNNIMTTERDGVSIIFIVYYGSVLLLTETSFLPSKFPESCD